MGIDNELKAALKAEQLRASADEVERIAAEFEAMAEQDRVGLWTTDHAGQIDRKAMELRCIARWARRMADR